MSDREFLIWKDEPTTNQEMMELSWKWGEKYSVEVIDETYDVVIPKKTEDG
jgi:hypothetical protein